MLSTSVGKNVRVARLYSILRPVEKFHIGRRIKAKLEELRIRKADLIRDTKIPQNTLYSIFKKPTIDTGVLSRINEATGHNFFLEFVKPEELHRLFSDKEFIDPEQHAALKKENLKVKKSLDELREKYIALLEKKELNGAHV